MIRKHECPHCTYKGEIWLPYDSENKIIKCPACNKDGDVTYLLKTHTSLEDYERAELRRLKKKYEDKVQRKMNTGNLVFVQGKGIISKIIRFFDEGDYSHVAIAVDYDTVIEADVNTKVVCREFVPDKYSKITIMDLGLTPDEAMRVVDEAQKLIGKRYDYKQLIWYGLKRLFNLEGRNRFNNPKNIICSELVFIVLSEAGILDELGIKYDHIVGIDLTPNELYDLVKFVSVS